MPRRAQIRTMRAVAALPLIAASVLLAGACGSADSAAVAPLADSDAEDPALAPEPGLLLPDLQQVVPYQLGIKHGGGGDGRGRRWHLGFASAVENLGRGPLLANGRRSSRRKNDMTVRQIIRHRDGGTTVRRDVGRMRFEVSVDHRHWHYLGFEEYELRPADDGQAVWPSRKAGFCLGDRYAADSSPPGTPPEPRLTGNCGRDPRLKAVETGISVGYGDDYDAYLEGQSIELTRLPAGRYVLIHRVNSERLLLEEGYANNAASVLLDLSWPRGSKRRPVVERVRPCPGSESCGTAAGS